MTTAQPRQVNPWAAMGALSIGFFMIMLDTTIVNVAIPAMLKGNLHATLNQIVWVNSVYLLTYAVPLLLTARLGDRIGRKQMFLVGLAVFTGASLWCALSRSPEMLITARAVQGLGAASMGPQTMAFITTLFPPAKRGAPMGAWGAVAGVATITGPLLGGLLVDNFGWQWIFMVNVPIGVIGLVLATVLVPGKQQRNRHRFDVLGTVLFSLGLLAVVFGVQNGQQYDWGRVWGQIRIPEIIGLGVVLLVAFVVWQRVNRNEPLLPLSLFGRRTFSAANVANVCIGFAITGMFLPVVIYLQSVLGLTPLASGVVTLPMSVVSGMVAPFAGKLSDRLPGKYVALVGFAALAVGVGWLALDTEVGASPWRFVPALAVAGIGIGCVFSPLANLATSAVDPPMMGAASGVFNTTRQVGGVLGSAAIGVLLQARLTVSMHAAAVASAASLPVGYRAQFVDSMAKAASSATSGGGTSGCALPPGVPASLANRLCGLGTATFQHGFTDATRTTLILPTAVLVLGALACLAISKRQNRPAWYQPKAPVAVAEAV
ncbi:MAG TPA: DHA2 family efflux MFS transporter permease subunit [Pseudonocardiaceae bacterium]|jgi:EmrB/QacA subfamily drug resistance transporter|nr:DHA2 family efflux MFS transporter permease subunit [Pseudonocardiaceae bacterium]